MSPSERLAAIKAQTPEEREEMEAQLLREMAHRYGEQWRRAEAELRERQEADKARRREQAGVRADPAARMPSRSRTPELRKEKVKPPSAAAPKDSAAVRRRKAAQRKGARHG